jgi:hypothetical protein
MWPLVKLTRKSANSFNKQVKNGWLDNYNIFYQCTHWKGFEILAQDACQTCHIRPHGIWIFWKDILY